MVAKFFVFEIIDNDWTKTPFVLSDSNVPGVEELVQREDVYQDGAP